MPWGSRISTQRMSAGGLPERYLTIPNAAGNEALPETNMLDPAA